MKRKGHKSAADSQFRAALPRANARKRQYGRTAHVLAPAPVVLSGRTTTLGELLDRWIERDDKKRREEGRL